MISFIIPTYNEEKSLGKTIDSLHWLTIPHEIIVTDNESTDQTRELARKKADIVLNFAKIGSNGKRTTIAANRNYGAAHAHGEYLVFVDSDCRIENANIFFKKALRDFEEKNLVGLTANVVVEPTIRTWWDDIILRANNRYYYFMNTIIGKGMAIGKFQMVKTEAFWKIGGYREDLAMSEDIDFFLRLSKIGYTYADLSLNVYHTNRRARKIGWLRLLFIWTVGTFYYACTGKSMKDEWTIIR